MTLRLRNVLCVVPLQLFILHFVSPAVACYHALCPALARTCCVVTFVTMITETITESIRRVCCRVCPYARKKDVAPARQHSLSRATAFCPPLCFAACRGAAIPHMLRCVHAQSQEHDHAVFVLVHARRTQGQYSLSCRASYCRMALRVRSHLKPYRGHIWTQRGKM